MGARFDSFVILAGMRTGSNLLESNLNALKGVTCHGEAFNAHFIGYPGRAALLGMSREERDRDPRALLDRIRRGTPEALHGFRYFHDHDPRVQAAILDEPAIAKIVLRRNPLDSYVSLKIARETDQWKLTDPARRKTARIRFDAGEFAAFTSAQQAFQALVTRALQVSGQAAFVLGFEDLGDLEILNGLAGWLGVASRLDTLQTVLKRQNPEPALRAVSNPAEMEAALRQWAPFDPADRPSADPRRGPRVPGYVTAPRTPLVFLPIPSGPNRIVRRWMAALDRCEDGALGSGFTRRALRDWMRERPGHRRFTVLSHPLTRAHRAFSSAILATGQGSLPKIRQRLRTDHALPIPEGAPGPDYDRAAHRHAFLAFLRWLRANLSGQTAMRVADPWASQMQCLDGIAGFALPDSILREEDLARTLPSLARHLGHAEPPSPSDPEPDTPFDLALIYDAEVEAAARAAYARDYLMLGFGDWA